MTRILIAIGLIFTLSSTSSLFAFNRAHIEFLRANNRCRGCDFYKANLDRMDLTNADLSGSNLKRAKFRQATLYGANLSGTNMMGTDFEGAMWIDGTICQKGSIGKCVRKGE